MERFDKLLRGYLNDKLSVSELEEFLSLVDEQPGSSLTLGMTRGELTEEVKERVWRSLAIARDDKKVRKIKPIYWAAAASIILLLSTYLLFFNNKTTKKDVIVKTTDVEAPKSTKATITLADGKVVVPEIVNGKVEDRFLSAAADRNDKGFNTLTNPKGSQVVGLTLGDGTKVWLNNESSLKYPVSFDGVERKVEITGEAYFECNKPGFVVVANGIEIKDLGTEFNVNSYESAITTLIKGKVQIGNSVLKVGEQAINDQIVGTVDVQQVVAWKNGLFEFDNTDLSVIMKQVSRWYDVEVVYEGKPNVGKLGGGISRNLPLSKVIELLKNNGINIRLENGKLYIK